MIKLKHITICYLFPRIQQLTVVVILIISVRATLSLQRERDGVAVNERSFHGVTCNAWRQRRGSGKKTGRVRAITQIRVAGWLSSFLVFSSSSSSSSFSTFSASSSTLFAQRSVEKRECLSGRVQRNLTSRGIRVIRIASVALLLLLLKAQYLPNPPNMHTYKYVYVRVRTCTHE